MPTLLYSVFSSFPSTLPYSSLLIHLLMACLMTHDEKYITLLLLKFGTTRCSLIPHHFTPLSLLTCFSQ
jgi:hypothetical protein